MRKMVSVTVQPKSEKEQLTQALEQAQRIIDDQKACYTCDEERAVGLYSEALRIVPQLALLLKPKLACALVDLGNVHFRERDYDVAYNFYEMALAHDSQHCGARHNQMSCLHRMNPNT